MFSPLNVVHQPYLFELEHMVCEEKNLFGYWFDFLTTKLYFTKTITLTMNNHKMEDIIYTIQYAVSYSDSVVHWISEGKFDKVY